MNRPTYVSASEQYGMMSVGLNDNDTEIQVVGPNLNCSSTKSLIPLFNQLEDNLPNTVDKFLTVSVAFSLETSTLVVCGGVQSKVANRLFVFIDIQIFESVCVCEREKAI